MKRAFIFIDILVSDTEKLKLCQDIFSVAQVLARPSRYCDDIVFQCDVPDLGTVFGRLSADRRTDWIKYKILFGF